MIHTFASLLPERSHYVLTARRDCSLRAQHTTMEFHRRFEALYGARHGELRWAYEAPAGAVVFRCDAGGWTGAGCEGCGGGERVA